MKEGINNKRRASAQEAGAAEVHLQIRKRRKRVSSKNTNRISSF
jgi:hypothetical protein